MSPRYTNEFKEEAAKQILKNGYPIRETAERLGVHPYSLGKWQYQEEILPLRLSCVSIKDYSLHPSTGNGFSKNITSFPA